MVTKADNLPILLFAFALLAACRPIQNYDDPREPVFEGSYAGSPPDFDGELKVITWNIQFSEEIDEAIAELSEVDQLQGADVILLQEMDEKGVDAIAKALNYDYVYFPASIHSHHDRNFGNAILSKWPLSDTAKLLLPYESPRNNQIRIAARAVVTVSEDEVLVYSVHTETFVLGEEKRMGQIDALVEDIGEEHGHVVVGGDFNTLTDDSIVDLEDRFAEVSMERASAGAEPTVEKAGLSSTLDHIFTGNMTTLNSGVWPETDASDHFPVWVNLSLE